MKKVLRIASVFIFTWFYLGLAVSSQAADRPVLQEGERWEFKASTRDSIGSSAETLNGVYEVVFRGGRLEVFEMTGNEKRPFTGTGAEELKRMILPDEREYLKFPLAVGNKWTGTHTQLSGTKVSSTRSMTYIITADDGGRYKVSGSGTAPGPKGSVISQERVFYYSPGEKAIVKFNFDSYIGGTGGKIDIDLLKFFSAGK